MYDQFEAFQRFTMPEFLFKSKKYIIWEKGKIIHSCEEETLIVANLLKISDDKIQTEIAVLNDAIYIHISEVNTYDIFVSSYDRLMLLTLPLNTNVPSAAIKILSFNYGYTCENKEFKYEDPYGCQLFMRNGKIAKLSMLFSNPERLIEFFQSVNYELKFFKKNLKQEHTPIINFFKQHGFGTINPVLTYLSVLSPDDRCTVLEELYDPYTINSVLNDKLLLAYITNGRSDLAKKVIINAENNFENQENIYFLKDKLDLGLAPSRTGAERIKIYNDFKTKARNKLELEFLDILINFCKKIG